MLEMGGQRLSMLVGAAKVRERREKVVRVVKSMMADWVRFLKTEEDRLKCWYLLVE